MLNFFSDNGIETYLDQLVLCGYLEASTPDKIKHRCMLADTSSSSGMGYTLFYSYQSEYVRSIIVDTIPDTLLQRYHRKIARFYEIKYVDNMLDVFPLVASHYVASCDYDRAFQCYERAARSHYYIGNEETGLELLQKALKLAPLCSFEDYEGVEGKMLVQWHTVSEICIGL